MTKAWLLVACALSHLHRTSAWSAVQNGSPIQIILNVCGPLPNDPYAPFSCSDPNSAACAVVNGQPVTLGSYLNSSLTVINASFPNQPLAFTLSYWGGLNNRNASTPAKKDGTCNGLYDRETVIIFTCGRSLVRSFEQWVHAIVHQHTMQGVPALISVEENCKYVFEWPTLLACTPPTASTNLTSCSLVNQYLFNYYDFTPLVKINSNWIGIDDNETFTYTYLFNMCGPLVNTYNIHGACVGAGACQLLRFANGTNVTVSLGQPASPTFDWGDLSVIYTGVWAS